MSFQSIPLSVVLSLVICVPLPAAPIPPLSPEKLRKELDLLWADLQSADELTAGRALLKLAARPDDSVKYLKEKLRPLILTKERAKQLLEELGGDDDKTVRAAFDEFAYFDPRLAWEDEELREALIDRSAGRRMGAILCDLPVDALREGYWHWNSPNNKVYRFNHPGTKMEDRDVAIAVAGIGTQGRKASWARAIRAIALLEEIGTDGAIALLKTMASGHPDAAPTKAATAVLKRISDK